MKNLTGRRFTRLVVVASKGKNERGQTLSLCLCDCGQERLCIDAELLRGNSKSCGCLTIEIIAAKKTRHGHCGQRSSGGRFMSRTYNSWRGMIDRCENPKSTHYRLYGGAGVVVCERWHVFENFLADMGERPERMTIERERGKDNYEPSNCKWATAKEQARNISRNRLLTLGGRTQCLSAWAEEHGLNVTTLSSRLKKKSLREALAA